MQGGGFWRYTLLRSLKHGGMAEVFLARQSGIEGFEKRVVIKRLLPHLAGDDKLVQMFLDEARLVAQLSHRNIAQVLDLGQLDDEYFIAMEYVHGRDLRELLRRKSLPLRIALQIGIELCEALAYAHSAKDATGQKLGVVHQDVSPHNVLISFDGAVKLIDFGLAKATERLEGSHSGTVRGKAAYLAPERFQGAAPDPRADIFALGVLLYEAVTSHMPFSGDSDAQRMYAILNEEMVPPSLWDPEFDPDLGAILRRALAKDPAERYQTADALRADLVAFVDSRGLACPNTEIALHMQRLFANELVREPEPANRAATATVTEDGSHPGGRGRKHWSRLGWVLGVLVVAAAGVLGTRVWPLGEEAPASMPADQSLSAPLPKPPAPAKPAAQSARPRGHAPPLKKATEARRKVRRQRLQEPRRDRRKRSNDAEATLAEQPAPAPTTKAPGFLTLKSTPWSEVYFRGELLGSTPIASRKLPAGRHLLRLSNPERGLTKQVPVAIHPGETTRLFIILE